MVEQDINTCLACITVMTEAVSLRLPDDLAQRLDRLSKSIERSKTYIVTKALSEYMEEYEDYLIALNRLNDKDDKIVTEKELKA